MDFNDITSRLDRVYNSINKSYEHNVASNVNHIFERSGKFVRVGVSFGTHTEIELVNRVFGIINAIGPLKDLLKKKLKTLNKDPQIVEKLIDSSEDLKLVIDLWNEDKHGYPLTKHQRSYKNPRIINIKQGLRVSDLSNKATITFTINAASQTVDNISSENSVISINGDVVDGDGNLITSLDTMIDTSVKKLENFINENGLA